MADLFESLQSFVTYVQTHLTGDEKGESADFLDHLFRALGHDGIKEAGATRETRLAKKGGAKGKNFADLLWPERVLWEMKSRGKKLERQYDQIFDYWTHIVPHRPPFVILCNFDEFWIYDFNLQLFDPVEKFTLAELPSRAEALAFLLPKPRKPLFNNNRVEVTREAAADLAQLFRALVARGEDRARAQRFILQLLVTLVSEDMHLLPRQLLTRLIAECRDKGENSYDLIGELFRQMNTKEPARGGRFTDVPYFNGGLFADIDPIDLLPAELDLLATAADRKWDMVKPEIFGTLFQSSMDSDERHAFGAHFTSEFDIRKVVGPTIVRPWREKMEAAWDKVGKLKEVLRDLRLFRVLDPACGSGNFLYVAYRELKRLEREILLRLSEISKGEPLETAVSIHQFHGIDIQPFAVELAKVTLMLAKEQEVRETAKLEEIEEIEEGFLVLENPLPLDNLDKNILCADALFTDWPKADAIIGNPPFISKNKLVPELGQAYVDKVRKKFPLVSGRADFCTYWFRLAHEHLEVGARAGLVATNTIRQNYSREGSLDYVVANGGTITDAVGTQVWSGDAVVHVSIINWINGASLGLKRLTTQLGDSVESPWHAVELETISAALSESTDVTTASVIHGNANSSACFQGQTHGHEGFLLTAGELSRFADSASVIHPYLTADELFSNQGGKPNRYSIDLNRCDDLFEARQFPSAFERVKERVLPDIQTKATDEFEKTGKSAGPRQTHFNKWWKFWRGRLEMLGHIESSDRYIVCGQVTKRPIFEFLSSLIRPNAALIVFPVADDYSFGVLQSVIHFEWFKARCSSLKGDFRYTSNTGGNFSFR